MGLELRPTLIREAAPSVADTLPLEIAEPVARAPIWWRLMKWGAAVVIAVLLIDLTASLLVQREHVRKRLDARLQAAFGRSVEVDSYAFSLWGGPTLVANGIRVGEDPRFGNEYFLRADSLAVRLRWPSLLRGRFELESLALSSPTVNVVNDSAGDWNLAEWLGHPPAPAANNIGPVRVPFVPHFRAIEVDDGRVNFKRGDDKLAFAFINVAGTINTDGDQRWRLDLEAAPWRAAEFLQQAGTIHVAGSVGGTSSALRPASLQLSWSDASLSDFLRLVGGDDAGIRGTVAIAVNAQTSAGGWALQGFAQLAQLHRWDLSVRPDAPALNVSAHMTLDVPGSTLQITDASVDGLRSNLRGFGKISWAGASVAGKVQSPVDLEIQSASIDFQDALAWLRAFRTRIPESLSVSGYAQAQAKMSGWPARVTNFAVRTDGAVLSSAAFPAPVYLGETGVAYDRGALQVQPATIAIAAADGTSAGLFHIESVATPAPRRSSPAPVAALHLSGSAADAASVIAIANAFGWDVARGWQIAGPLHCDLRWPQLVWPWTVRPVGTVTVGGAGDDAASLRAPFLNLPVSGLQLRMDWKPGARHVALVAAQAFGAHWNGAFDRADAAPEWQFALAADHLSAADLDRWLNPRWRESFLDRMLPFLASAPPTAVPDSLRGDGRIAIGELSAAPFAFQNVAGNLTVAGRNLSLDNATAELAGGKVSASFDAQLMQTPAYRLRANFADVDLAALTGGTQPDAAPFAGTATGEAQFSMQGAARSDFAESLDCKGTVDIRNAAWRGVSLDGSLHAANLAPGDSLFSDASGQFACEDGGVTLNDVALIDASGQLAASGTVDFSRRLDLQVRVLPPGTAAATLTGATGGAANSIHVTGTVDAPEFSRPPVGRRSR
jgi:uncharacterized protein involved in outer membrane biogenesis